MNNILKYNILNNGYDDSFLVVFWYKIHVHNDLKGTVLGSKLIGKVGDLNLQII